MFPASAMNAISRTCGGPKLMYNNGCEEQSQGNAKGSICECSTDLCNSASIVTVQFVVLISVVMALAMKFLS